MRNSNILTKLFSAQLFLLQHFHRYHHFQNQFLLDFTYSYINTVSSLFLNLFSKLSLHTFLAHLGVAQAVIYLSGFDANLFLFFRFMGATRMLQHKIKSFFIARKILYSHCVILFTQLIYKTSPRI